VPAAFGEALEARQFEVELDCGFPSYSFRRNTPDAAVASVAAAQLTAFFRRWHPRHHNLAASCGSLPSENNLLNMTPTGSDSDL
jgi:hypothetical protein